MSIWKRALALLSKEPTQWAVPSLLHAPLDMQWLIDTMGENVERPRVGDLIIELVADSMAVCVKHDIRYRVVQSNSPYPNSVCAENCDSARAHILHIFYMRRHKTLPRVWFLAS
jgi:hypothetical protein